MAAQLTRRRLIAGTATTAAAGAAAIAVAKHPWTDGKPAPTTKPTKPPTPAASTSGILVLVGLYGGNDGLNTVVPYQDGAYLGGRPQLGYQPDQVLPIGDGLALHPNLKGLKALWDSKQLAIVRGVGYPDPNRSHFRSMDIWQTGVPEHAEPTGWLGRWLDATGTDPLRALSIGPTMPPALAGLNTSGAAIPNGALRLPGGPTLRHAVADLNAPDPNQPALAARVTQVGRDLLTVQATVATALATPPATATTQGKGLAASGLGGQLDVVARLIKAGVPTRVYAVALSGFDNHADEKDAHAQLLGELDQGISSFLQSLQGDRHAAGVVVMTFSEFGRRVAQNASGGTDHGTAAPVFVAGPPVRGGFYGDQPSLSDLDEGDLKFTTDFRSVYATVLAGTVGVDPKLSLGKPFPLLGFL
jgi:uncharacterized protein (DUF1501 family)